MGKGEFEHGIFSMRILESVNWITKLFIAIDD